MDTYLYVSSTYNSRGGDTTGLAALGYQQAEVRRPWESRLVAQISALAFSVIALGHLARLVGHFCSAPHYPEGFEAVCPGMASASA